jgi:hypothetical protein
VYVVINFETAALETPNNVAVFIADAPTKHAPTLVPFEILENLPFYRTFI